MHTSEADGANAATVSALVSELFQKTGQIQGRLGRLASFIDLASRPSTESGPDCDSPLLARLHGTLCRVDESLALLEVIEGQIGSLPNPCATTNGHGFEGPVLRDRLKTMEPKRDLRETLKAFGEKGAEGDLDYWRRRCWDAESKLRTHEAVSH